MSAIPFPVLYLHGFASSPASRKAQFFAERLGALGTAVEIPELAPVGFERLTVTSQLEIIERACGTEPHVLIGSSLGGYLAALFAARHPEVPRIILLAPAFGFRALWMETLGPERLNEWQRRGTIPVFHYGEGRELPLDYRFIEDAARYEAFPSVSQPALLFHGRSDPVVPVQQSLRFVRLHPDSARLVELPSGHELTDVLEDIWRDSESFLFGDRPGGR